MTLRLMRLAATVAAVAILIGDPRGSAAQTQPESMVLPDIPLVAVTSTAEAPVRSLPSQGRWVLVHMQANCAPCDALLARIETEARAIAPRLVIVVSGSTPADVGELIAAYAGLEPAAWFADPPGGLSAALRIEETPLVLAMNDRSIQWTLAGVLAGTPQLRDVLTAWVTVPGH